MKVHRALGPGFLESVYQNALLLELRELNLDCEWELPLEVHYRGHPVGTFLADIVVEGRLILELKACQNLNEAHEVQLVNYLTATGLENGLLLNFGAPSLGVKRKFKTYHHPNPVNLVNPVQKFNLHAFTVLELLVAMTVFAILVVMLMGMVDSGTKLWRANENRVDSYREARAALGIISRDLSSALAGSNAGHFLINSDAYPLLSNAEKNTNSAGALFFLSAQPAGAQEPGANKSDVCQVGYFLAYGNTSMVPSGQGESSMNLYRYFLSSDATFALLTNSPVFPSGLTPTDPRVELLARNIQQFRIQALGTNGSPHLPTAAAPLPPVVQVEIVALNQETAKKLIGKSQWTAPAGNLSNVIAGNEQTFTTRIRLPRTR